MHDRDGKLQRPISCRARIEEIEQIRQNVLFGGLALSAKNKILQVCSPEFKKIERIYGNYLQLSYDESMRDAASQL
jgi:hypothetical protein